MNLTIKEISRFYSKTRKSGDCILWTAKPDSQGYGRMLVGTRGILAHHIAYWLKTKTTPSKYIIHTCGNKLCVNPQHLTEGPNKGRPHTISPQEIRSLKTQGKTNTEIARALSCSLSTVKRALK